MGDLISRSAVIELLQKNMTRDIQDQIITENNINLICSVPTAYNVDAVVAKLEEENEKWLDVWNEQKYDQYADGMTDAFAEAISIVNELAEEYNSDCCAWKQYDENDIYYTGCEQIHMFIDGSPTDNKYEFCPYCGKKIKVAPYTEGETELYRAKSVDGEYQEYKGDWK